MPTQANTNLVEKSTAPTNPTIQTSLKPEPNFSGPKVSAFSLASIKAKKVMEESTKTYVKPTVNLPTEPFTETELLIQWNNYAKKLSDKGHKIMESLLMIKDPVLDGTLIKIELPNEGSKLDFENQQSGLLGHLRGHLHNHDIDIEVIVNEAIKNTRSLNDQDRYNRLAEINPNIELLRKTFGLNISS